MSVDYSGVAGTVADVFLFLFLVTIILVSILGNVLVVIAIVTDQRLRKLSNLFLVRIDAWAYTSRKI